MSQSSIRPQFENEFLNDYMDLVEDTESPRMYHLWAALYAIGSSLGRRCYLPFGSGQIYPNQFVLLVGNPGTRKSTALATARRLLADATNVRFAPSDTAGQRQGLVSAMQHEDTQAEEDKVVQSVNPDSLGGISLTAIADSDNSQTGSYMETHYADKHHLVVMASEFSTFIGQNNLGMIDFLTTMWDGDDYEYRIKAGQTTLGDPLLNVMGATTPTSLAKSLPAAATGQGFLSRLILVYGATKYKLVPRPVAPDAEKVLKVKSRLAQVYNEFHGAFTESPEAYAYSVERYKYIIDLTDSRFTYYQERRYTHLLKLAMILCAANGRMEIQVEDYKEAHRILRATEGGMPEALGEFGLSPLAQTKQGILDFVRGANEPITFGILRQVFHRDATMQDIQTCLDDLCNAKQLKLSAIHDGTQVYLPMRQRKDLDKDIENLMAL